MPQKILIAEPEVGLAASYRRALRGEGFAVEVASDGPDAADRLRRSPPQRS